MLAVAGEARLLEALPDTFAAMRTALNFADDAVVGQALCCTSALLRAAPGVAPELQRLGLLRRLLPVPNLLLRCHREVSPGYPPRRARLSQLAEGLLAAAEEMGGADGRAEVHAFVRSRP